MTRARAYYNEHEPYAADWLRNLIAAGVIAPGDVDERDIRDVRPADLRGYTQCHFFAGIGVWSYALRRAGWPDDRPVWTASCPCQPLSAAGQGLGFDDERHLWPDFHHLVRVCRPGEILGEQVASKLGLEWLDLVHDDLEGEGYAVGSPDLCAAGVGAPNIRQRLWWVAHTMRPGWPERRPGTGIGSIAGSGIAGGMAGPDPVGCRGRAGSDAPRLQGAQFPGQDHRGAGELADAVRGGRQGAEPIGPAGGGRRFADTGGAGRPGILDHAFGNGWRARRDDHAEHERVVSDAAGVAGTLAHPDQHRRDPASRHPGRAEERDVEPCGQLGDTGGTGLEVGSGASVGPGALRIQGAALGAAEPVRGFWRGADWIWCRDGKFRPVEPGTFPLAYGVAADLGSVRPGQASPFRTIIEAQTGEVIGQAPWRVGMLRGYGNAINAETAIAFIRAYLDERPAS